MSPTEKPMPEREAVSEHTPVLECRNLCISYYTRAGEIPAVVDFNLRQLPQSNAYEIGPFDKDSIMKYFFPAWMFTLGTASPCYTDSENLKISDGDKAGAAKVYPRGPAEIKAAAALQMQALEAVTKTPQLSPAAEKHFQQRLKMIKN